MSIHLLEKLHTLHMRSIDYESDALNSAFSSNKNPKRYKKYII